MFGFIQQMIQDRLKGFEQNNTIILVEEYRQINKNLRRIIKDKDVKIMQLFNCIDEATKKIKTNRSQIVKATPQREKSINVKLTLSQNNKREKENMISSNAESNNIFKQKSFSLMGREINKKESHLPTLQKKTKLSYPMQDSIFQNPEIKGKIVKIPLERLKPLNSKEVKKRFLMKFQRKQIQNQQIF